MGNFELYAPILMAVESKVQPSSLPDLPNERLFDYIKGNVVKAENKLPKPTTVLGVSLSVYKEQFGNGKSIRDLRQIKYPEWHYIMKKCYWDLVRGDEIRNQSIAEIFADWAVTSGNTAIRRFQQSQGLSTDGVVGQKLLSILNSPNQEVIFNRIKSARESFYRKVAIIDPSQRGHLYEKLCRVNYFSFKGTE